MSERREINGTPAILRMLADEVEANDALTQALETARAATVNASKHGLLEICRLDSLLHMTALEAAALASDLDDMQAEWAAEIAMLSDVAAFEQKRIATAYDTYIAAKLERIEKLEVENERLATELAATCEAWRNDKDFRAHTAPKAPSVPRRATPGLEVDV